MVNDDREQCLVVTRQRSEEDFQAWLKSADFAAGHSQHRERGPVGKRQRDLVVRPARGEGPCLTRRPRSGPRPAQPPSPAAWDWDSISLVALKTSSGFGILIFGTRPNSTKLIDSLGGGRKAGSAHGACDDDVHSPHLFLRVDPHVDARRRDVDVDAEDLARRRQGAAVVRRRHPFDVLFADRFCAQHPFEDLQAFLRAGLGWVRGRDRLPLPNSRPPSTSCLPWWSRAAWS